MKIFLKEFAIWMGGLMILNLLLFTFVIPHLYVETKIITDLLFVITGAIIAITRLKLKFSRVHFGYSFLSALIICFTYYILTAIYYYSVDDFYSDSLIVYLLFNLPYFFINIAAILYILIFAGIWYTLKKADKPGFAFLIPIYNIIVMLQIAKKPVWWIILLLIPIANIVFMIMMLNGISKNFGKDEGFTVGLVFLGPVFWCILGYGDAKYIDHNSLKTKEDRNDLLDQNVNLEMV